MKSHDLKCTSDGSTVILTGSHGTLPTVVIQLSETCLTEIDVESHLPVEIQTMDYSHDRPLLERVIGKQSVDIIDRLTFDTPLDVPFTPTEDWKGVLRLAAAEWNLHWNPLPLDFALLSLDLIRAQHQVIHITGKLPNKEAAMVAYPATQALERLLNAGAISENATDQVRQGIRAVRDSLPLGYTDSTTYTLPLPLSEELTHHILDPQPLNPSALLTGSPDWHLTGHGPAASSENSITVTQHARNARAITITVPAKLHINPENAPIYQAFITDPETKATVAATNLTFGAESGEYAGHTIPQRSIRSSDQVDIRHYDNPNPPNTDAKARLLGLEERQATRIYVETRLLRSAFEPDGLLPPTITQLACTGQLLREVSGESASDVEDWLRLEVGAATTVRSAGQPTATNKVIKLQAKDSKNKAVVTLLGAPARGWVLFLAAPRELATVRITIRWESLAETEVVLTHQAGQNARSSMESPRPDDVPTAVRITMLGSEA